LAKLIHFEKELDHDLYLYKYQSGHRPVEEVSWSAAVTAELARQPTTSEEYGHRLWDLPENSLLYLGLVWRLTHGRARYGTPTWHRDAAAEILDQQPAMVNWEYRAAAQSAAGEQKSTSGFVRARVALPSSEPTDWQLAHATQAGIFVLTSFNDIIGLVRASQYSNAAEINIFALKDRSERDRQLVQVLQGNEEPQLNEILQDDEIFADVVFSTDESFEDVLIVASTTPLDERLSALCEEYRERADRYEAAAARAPDRWALSRALRDLTGAS
jgi:hypothetical protein